MVSVIVASFRGREQGQISIMTYLSFQIGEEYCRPTRRGSPLIASIMALKVACPGMMSTRTSMLYSLFRVGGPIAATSRSLSTAMSWSLDPMSSDASIDGP